MILLKPYTIKHTRTSYLGFLGMSNHKYTIVYDETDLCSHTNYELVNQIVGMLNGAYNEGRISTLNYPFNMED